MHVPTGYAGCRTRVPVYQSICMGKQYSRSIYVRTQKFLVHVIIYEGSKYQKRLIQNCVPIQIAWYADSWYGIRLKKRLLRQTNSTVDNFDHNSDLMTELSSLGLTAEGFDNFIPRVQLG